MFRSIQLVSEPLRMRMSSLFLEKCRSQADFSLPRKVGSFAPSQLISSRTTTHLPAAVRSAKAQSSVFQSSARGGGMARECESCCAKSSRLSLFGEVVWEG